MFKFAVFLGLALCTFTASAGLEGSWYCSNTNKSVIRVKGRTVRNTDHLSSTYELAADGTYVAHLATVPFPETGSYRVRGRTAKFFPNLYDIAKAAVYLCSITGQTCTVLAVSAKLDGTVNKAGTIVKVHASEALSIFYPASNVIARATVQTTGRCERI